MSIGDLISLLFDFNPLGTGDLKFYQSQGLSKFWELIFVLLNSLLFVMVANLPHYLPNLTTM